MNCSVQQVVHAMRVLDKIRDERTPLREMNVVKQSRELGYYFLDDEGKLDRAKADQLRAALNDWLSPEKVLRMYRSQDGSGLLQLVHEALLNGLEHEIDKQEDEK